MVLAWLLNRSLTRQEREDILQSTMKGDPYRASGTKREVMIEKQSEALDSAAGRSPEEQRSRS
jgi:hypothetical protein